MEAQSSAPETDPQRAPIDWEAFYRNYRKPGYLTGFEIVNKLGGGVFGIVFKARKESIGKDYAVKFLKVDDEVVRDAVARELDSVRYFAQIDHPNLVSIEDKGEIDGIPYIVMSYAGQETLRSRLQAGRLDRDEALRVFIQAARGVQALHEHSLVHFDLKPANIFLKGDIARVGDYGLSKLVTESRNTLSFGRGTPYYMAPEMLHRRGDTRSDVYSLGIILFECLTGDVPFRGESEWEVLRKHEAQPVEIPAEIGQPERAVIERCLAKDPADRFASVQEMLQLLGAPSSLGESIVFPGAGGTATAAGPRTWRSRATNTGADGSDRRTRGSRGEEQAARGWRAHQRRTGRATHARGATAEYEDTISHAWRHGRARRGPIATLVHLVFRLIEGLVLAILAPLRLISAGFGRVLVFTLQLPLRILSAALQLAGYLIIALLVLLIIAAIVSLLASVAPA